MRRKWKGRRGEGSSRGIWPREILNLSKGDPEPPAGRTDTTGGYGVDGGSDLFMKPAQQISLPGMAALGGDTSLADATAIPTRRTQPQSASRARV
jgi:hypothetical protein